MPDVATFCLCTIRLWNLASLQSLMSRLSVLAASDFATLHRCNLLFRDLPSLHRQTSEPFVFAIFDVATFRLCSRRMCPTQSKYECYAFAARSWLRRVADIDGTEPVRTAEFAILQRRGCQKRYPGVSWGYMAARDMSTPTSGLTHRCFEDTKIISF